MTDKELEKIYSEAYKAVYWTAMSLLKNEADAEDIVQDTFVSLIESYDSIEDKSKVTAWLKKTAANKSLNRLTRTKTDAVEDEFFEDAEAVPEDFLPDSIVESAEMRKIIMNIIENSLSDVIISCTLKEGKVKHVSFESDDDIDLNYLFSGSETIESIELPANLTELPPIDSCKNLKEITIPKGVTEIPAMNFYNDQSLVTVTIEGDVTEIGDNAFKQCYSLENINLPDSIVRIGDYAFDKCESLRTVTLPEGLKEVGRNAFKQLEGGIQTFIVPEGMELENWDLDAFEQFKSDYTVKVVSGSWADSNFDEVFYGNAVKEYA